MCVCSATMSDLNDSESSQLTSRNRLFSGVVFIYFEVAVSLRGEDGEDHIRNQRVSKGKSRRLILQVGGNSRVLCR